MTLDEFNQAINKIRQQIDNENATFDLIIGLSRGGLVPAVFLSHQLNIPMLVADVTHELSMGDNIASHSNTIPVIPKDIKSILVVDDIVDSGNTILALYENLKTDASLTVAALYVKVLAEDYLIDNTCTRFKGCIAANIIAPDNDEWIDFPWELTEL
jgi:hypoxanthine phosphoribosyltransferase